MKLEVTGENCSISF